MAVNEFPVAHKSETSPVHYPSRPNKKPLSPALPSTETWASLPSLHHHPSSTALPLAAQLTPSWTAAHNNGTAFWPCLSKFAVNIFFIGPLWGELNRRTVWNWDRVPLPMSKDQRSYFGSGIELKRIVAVLVFDDYSVQFWSLCGINILGHRNFSEKHAPRKKLRVMRMTNPVSQLGYWQWLYM